jgi:hypothetical protein
MNVIWTEFLMKCVHEYFPIQQQRVSWRQLIHCCCTTSSNGWLADATGSPVATDR